MPYHNIRNVIEIMYCITLLLLLLLLKNELKNDYFKMISIKLRLTWISLYHFVNTELLDRIINFVLYIINEKKIRLKITNFFLFNNKNS